MSVLYYFLHFYGLIIFLLKDCVEHSAIPDYYTHGMLAQFGERFLEYSMLHNTIALCNWTFGLSYLY